MHVGQGDDLTTTAGDIYCFGWESCDSATDIVIDDYEYDIWCYGYSSCRDADYITTDFGDIYCVGPYSCYSTDNYIRGSGSSSIIECSGHYSCGDSTISRGNTLICRGPYSCNNVVVTFVENIYSDGYYGARNGYISSYGISSNNMTVYLRGFQAGNGLTLICYEADHTCYLFCQATGCNNTEIDDSGSGTWIVDCDESQDQFCPIGYFGPTPGPTVMPIEPTSIPTDSPTGGSEGIICVDSYQCQYQSLIGTYIDCDGYHACQGSGTQTISSTHS